MASQQLKQKAQQAVCSCYYWDLCNVIDEMEEKDLKAIVKDPYQPHKINKDDLKECPQWVNEQTNKMKKEILTV